MTHLALALSLVATLGLEANAQETKPMAPSRSTAPSASDTLSAHQQAIVPIAALAAAGDLTRLNPALNQGLDAGLTVSDAREILVQLYAYAGFPRSLNALGELMKVLEARYPGRARPRAQPSHPAGRCTAGRRHGQPDPAGRRAGRGAVVRFRARRQ